MSSLAKRLYSPLLFDFLFASSGVLGVTGIVLDAGKAFPAITPGSQPLIKGAVLVGAIIVAVMIAIVSTRFDQKQADDFLFQTLAKSAFVAMFAIFFTLLFWQLLFAASFGGVSTHATIGVLIASWSLAYLYTRVRGTGL